MRDNENVITYNWFQVVSQYKEDISDCKGLRDVNCHGNQISPKIGKRIHKNGHNFSCVQHINAEFGLR